MEIKKTLITDEELKKEYNITIPSEIIVLKADEEIAELQKTYKMNGFRPGKVPVNIIKEKEWTYVFSKACENAINDIVYNIIEENKYDLSYKPSISIKTMEDNKDVEFSVVYELLPNIDNIKLEDITIDKYEANITDKDIDKSIKNILSSYKNWEKKDDTAKLGDSVKINFVGTINGEEFEGGKAEDYQLELGSHSFIDNFEDQIVGKKAGDKIDVNVTFPDNYHKSSLAGKPALFKVVIKAIKTKEVPELDDEFASDVSDFDTLDEYKEDLKKTILEKKEKAAKTAKENALVDKVIENAQMDIPEPMIELEVRQMADEFAQRMQMQGLSMEQYMQYTGLTSEKLLEEMKPNAEKKIKTRLVLEAVVDAEKIEVSAEELEAEYKKLADMYQMEVDKVKEIMGTAGEENMKKDIAVQKAVDVIADSAK